MEADDADALGALPMQEDNNMIAERSAKGGRGAPTAFWQFFADDVEPHKSKSAICKHCRTRFNHHKKSEQAMQHFNSCPAFCKAMNGMEIDDRPDWYNTFKMKKRARLSETMRGAGSTAGFHTPNYASPASISSNMTSSATRRTSSIKDHLLPKMNASTKERFEQAIAMHYYTTGTSFKRIEEPNLAVAIKILRPDAVRPNRKKLAGPLLEQPLRHKI